MSVRLPFQARRAFRNLVFRLGRVQADQELSWIIRESSRPSTALPSLIKRRARGEPLQYILGTQPFGRLNLHVEPPTLIPRPETEEWGLWLAEDLKGSLSDPKMNLNSDANPVRVRKKLTALDLCTGTGCIPLLLSSELPPHTFAALGIDVSLKAISLARRNLQHLDLARQESITFQHLDLFSPIDDIIQILRSHPLYPFDIITSNPPYIPRSEWEVLPASVKAYEDPLALIGEPPSLTSRPRAAATAAVGNSDDHTAGLAFYHRIAEILHLAPDIIKPNGRLVVELGQGQARAVQAIFNGLNSTPLCEVDDIGGGEDRGAVSPRSVDDGFGIWNDASGIGRVVFGRIP